MARRSARLAIGLLTLVVLVGAAGWWLGPAGTRPESSAARDTASVASGTTETPTDAASPYLASDPALLAATGRPQLVEFYHRL